MKKSRKIVTIVLCTLVGMVLLFYIACGFYNKKPGMNGFSVTNGTLWLLVSGKDYVKVGEDRFLFRRGTLGKLLETEYADCDIRFETYDGKPLEYTTVDEFYTDEYSETSLMKTVTIQRGAQKLRARFNGVWSILCNGEIEAIYFCEQ